MKFLSGGDVRVCISRRQEWEAYQFNILNYRVCVSSEYATELRISKEDPVIQVKVEIFLEPRLDICFALEARAKDHVPRVAIRISKTVRGREKHFYICKDS